MYIYVFKFPIYNFATIKIENACFFSATDTREFSFLLALSAVKYTLS